MTHTGISFHDESALTWYFGAGQTAFERSTIGPMLAHAELFSSAGELRYCERHEGYQVEAERIRRAPSAWASVADGAIVYSGCEVTARPTAELRQASGYTPNLADMERFAWVSRVLRAVQRRNTLALTILEAYHGDLGASWAREAKPGKLAALYHLTQAGARLLDVSATEARAKGQPVIGAPARRMANEIARRPPPDRVRIGLHRCADQATVLLREAHAQWAQAHEELEGGRAA